MTLPPHRPETQTVGDAAEEPATDLAFARQLAARRRVLGMSQDELASLTGVSERTIASIERGTKRLNHQEADRLADMLGLALGRTSAQERRA